MGWGPHKGFAACSYPVNPSLENCSVLIMRLYSYTKKSKSSFQVCVEGEGGGRGWGIFLQTAPEQLKTSGVSETAARV